MIIQSSGDAGRSANVGRETENVIMVTGSDRQAHVIFVSIFPRRTVVDPLVAGTNGTHVMLLMNCDGFDMLFWRFSPKRAIVSP